MKSIDSVFNYLSGVRTLHKLLELVQDAFESVHLRLTLRGLRNLSDHKVNRKAPITPEILLKLYISLNFADVSDLCFWAVCLAAFFSTFRMSNLLPKTQTTFNARFQPRRGSVFFTESAAVLITDRSKTQQAAPDWQEFPLVRIKHSPLCPVQALVQYFKAMPASKISPCFIQGNGVPLTINKFVKQLKTKLSNLGYDAERFAGHSFRRGGTTWAHRVGVPAEYIKLMGNWKSNCYERYIDFSLQARIEAGTRMGLLL
jgi:hypothetical protein